MEHKEERKAANRRRRDLFAKLLRARRFFTQKTIRERILFFVSFLAIVAILQIDLLATDRPRKVLECATHDVSPFGSHVLQDFAGRRLLAPMCRDFVCAKVLVVDVLDLESLCCGVRILAHELFGQLAPHQRLRLGV